MRAAATLTCVYGGGGGGVFTALACCGAFVGQLVAEVVGQAETFVFLSAQRPSWEQGYRLPVGCAMLVAEISGELGGVQRQAWWPLVSARSSWARRQSPTPRPTAAQCTARSPPSHLSN